MIHLSFDELNSDVFAGEKSRSAQKKDGALQNPVFMFEYQLDLFFFVPMKHKSSTEAQKH